MSHGPSLPGPRRGRANRQQRIESLSVQAECLAGNEAGLQRVIVAALKLAGFVVLQTNRHRKRCWRCGTWPSGGDGCDKGVPDLLIWAPARGAWIGVELKKTGGRLSPEQAALARRSMIHVARSLEEVLRAVGADDALAALSQQRPDGVDTRIKQET
jgi:hypothetical protein